MISNHLNLVEQRRGAAFDLSEQIAQYLAANGKIVQLESPPINPDPGKRSTKIDPETILKRRKPPITRAEREALRKLAEAL
ncbi:hypothetical protein C9382_27710 [Pseudomonas aylmerensis]|uniref:Uncharacterized protein n=1 Tax=Pseudomonas aylmerensis TaxID=1869229 RepID=A0A2T4FN10_9PSED|nr:hypothetical protein [Pseudomonas aylmerensis]OCW24898.1 hypothetical protein BBG20_17645 [Pseudomonas aylmerensis]PTC24817.1 hypothetical protein C9382_27710 [Pseudomonas aylmerensis]